MNDDQNHPRRRTGPGSEPSPWLKMARELATNPDSPKSLAIMSVVSGILRPRERAVEQLVAAMADQLERPGAAADASVAAAVKHWESACHVQAEPDQMERFRQSAVDLMERRRRQPPPIESIVAGTSERSDVGYDLGVDLQGLRGTWHRLWAAVSLARSFGHAPEQQAAVHEIRGQFEEALGRALSSHEWSQLTEHACRHADTVGRELRGSGTLPGPGTGE